MYFKYWTCDYLYTTCTTHTIINLMRKAFIFRLHRFLNYYNYTVKNMVDIKVHKELQFSSEVVSKSGCTYLQVRTWWENSLFSMIKLLLFFIAIIQCDGLSLIDGSGETADGYPPWVEAALLKWLPLFKIRMKNHQQNEK